MNAKTLLFIIAMTFSSIAFAEGVTMKQYLEVKTGMTYEEVVNILGEPNEEMSRSEMAGHTTVMYMWKGTSLGANMNVMIQDNQLVTKSQFGLR